MSVRRQPSQSPAPADSRREFLLRASLAGGLAALAATPHAAAADPQCDAPTPVPESEKRAPSYDFPSGRTRVRKEVHDLSDEEVKRLAAAYQALKARDPKEAHSWCQQANMHEKHCAHGPGDRPPGADASWVQVHFGWYFLPWHRAYLYFYESILAVLADDDAFALPYWDWTKNPKLPDWLFIKDSKDPRNSLHHPNRRVKPGESIVKDQAVRNATSPEMIDQILALPYFFPPRPGLGGSFGGPPDSDQISGWLQGALESVPHNAIHVWVGGDMGSFDTAARDILFFCHHANVDRLWATWLQTADHANPTSRTWLDRWFNFHEPKHGNQVSVTTADTIDITRVNVVYQPPGTKETVSRPAKGDDEKKTLSDRPLTTPALRVVEGRGETLKSQPAGPPRKTVRLAVEGFQAPPNVGMRIHAFINNDKADEKTPLTEEKGYAGTLFVVPVTSRMMPGHKMEPPPLILSLEIGDRAEKLLGKGDVKVTLVPEATDREGQPAKGQVTFRSVAVVEE